MTDEFDPDRALPGDPPIDAKSMLDVIAEAEARAKQQLASVKAMAVPYAIRAILDGADVREVAASCGFLQNVIVEDPNHQEISLPGWGDVIIDMRTMGIVGRPGEDRTIDDFAEWLGKELMKLIQEKAR